MRESVTVHMAAPAERIWAVVSDVTRVGEFSPETFEAEWLDGASGPGVGVRFRGHVKRNGRGPVYWTNCRITECEPERVFGFAVEGPRGQVVDTWTYELVPSGEGGGGAGTDVTESFQIGSSPVLKLYWLLAGWARGRTNREGMRTTLERIRAVVEADA